MEVDRNNQIPSLKKLGQQGTGRPRMDLILL
jgi:hypothetical protein